jgi:glutaredoxin 3
MYTTAYCPFCTYAKAQLAQRGLEYTEIDVGHNPEALREMLQRSERRTVPQVFFGDKHIGGSDDLAHYFAREESARN